MTWSGPLLDTFGEGKDGRLFRGPLGGLIDESTYLAIWSNARQAVLTPAQFASNLAKRPYDLRHFVISFWLLAGVAVTQVATWAGNSEAVIWTFYAKLLLGQEKAALKNVENAIAEHEQEELPEP